MKKLMVILTFISVVFPLITLGKSASGRANLQVMSGSTIELVKKTSKKDIVVKVKSNFTYQVSKTKDVKNNIVVDIIF